MGLQRLLCHRRETMMVKALCSRSRFMKATLIEPYALDVPVVEVRCSKSHPKTSPLTSAIPWHLHTKCASDPVNYPQYERTGPLILCIWYKTSFLLRRNASVLNQPQKGCSVNTWLERNAKSMASPIPLPGIATRLLCNCTDLSARSAVIDLYPSIVYLGCSHAISAEFEGVAFHSIAWLCNLLSWLPVSDIIFCSYVRLRWWRHCFTPINDTIKDKKRELSSALGGFHTFAGLLWMNVISSNAIF